MVELVPYEIKHFGDLNSFQLDEIQSEFTASFYQNIIERKIESMSGKFPVTILQNQQPIGFFILDNSEEKLIYTENPEAILLRSLSLNPNYQGKGIGKQTMLLLDDYVLTRFPQISYIILAVNFRNENAIQLYHRTGYQNTDRVFNGIKGPQHIMVKSIK